MKVPSGVVLILGATVIAAAASYVVIWLVPQQIGLAAYTPFGLFWASMYLVVSALSGLQQEITRATIRRPLGSVPRVNPARNFGIALAGSVLVLVIATAPVWVEKVFPVHGWALVWPLAVASASYVLVATLAGTLYGLSQWVPLALMISVDAILRLAAVGVVGAVTDDTVALAWAAAVPFLLTVALLWPGFRRSVVGRTSLDVGYRALTWNVARTVVAAASMGVVISGLPVVIGIAATNEPPEIVAALFLAITITRAPVIVTILSLQSYLVVRFRDTAGTLRRELAILLAAVAAGGLVLAVLAWAFAPALFDFLYRGEFRFDGWFYASLVVSSALVGALAVTAPAVLARSQHVVYSLGWLASAVVTIASFTVPIDLQGKTLVAVFAGPAAGLIVHLAYLSRRRAATKVE